MGSQKLTIFEADTPALCRSTDPDIWFPEPSKSRLLKGESGQEIISETIIALDLCQACPLKAECLQFAVDNREAYGIFGGTFPHERDEMSLVPSGQPIATPFYTKLRKAVLELREDLVCPEIPKPKKPYVPYLELLYSLLP
jgi:WhiB family transcriptional regulator, redox-sensing transcriptional regulator